MVVSDTDVSKYRSFQKMFLRYSYDKLIFKGHNIKRILSILQQHKIWLLKKFKVENYVKEDLIIDNKLAVDKLNEKYFPTNLRELKTYLKNEALNELTEIVMYIIRTFDLKNLIKRG